MKSKKGIYLGVSPFHSSTVHLVLNPATGSMTPQYHLVFYDTFSTVFSNGQFEDSTWTNLLLHGHELHVTIQLDLTGTIHIPPDCAPVASSSSPLSSIEGALDPTLPHHHHHLLHPFNHLRQRHLHSILLVIFNHFILFLLPLCL